MSIPQFQAEEDEEDSKRKASPPQRMAYFPSREFGAAIKSACKPLTSPMFAVDAAASRVSKMLPAELDPTAWTNRDFVLAKVSKNGSALKYAPAEFRADSEIVMRAVRQDGTALRYAASFLKADRTVVLTAVTTSSDAFLCASDGLRANLDFVRVAVQQKPDALAWVAPPFQANRDVVMAAVQRDGRALRYAAEELQSDEDIVHAAVKNNGEALRYAAAGFMCVTDLALEALSSNPELMRHLPVAVRSDPRIIETVLFADSSIAMRYTPNDFWGQRNAAVEILRRSSSDKVKLAVVNRVGPELWKDRDFVMEAVKCRGYLLGRADPHLLSDREIVLAAVREDGTALQHAAASLHEDIEILRTAIHQNKQTIHWVHSDSHYYDVLSQELRHHHEVVEPPAGARYRQ